jgi:hypothetical protein
MNEQVIKTSEEIKTELADKKIAKTYLAEFENGIEEKLKLFESKLNDFKPVFNIKHSITSLTDIEALNTSINDAVKQLNNISIPAKIELTEKKEIKISINDKTRAFLLTWSLVCFVLAVGGSVYGILAYKKTTASNQENFEKGIFKGRNQIYNISTSAGRKRIDKNYPNWKKVQ